MYIWEVKATRNYGNESTLFHMDDSKILFDCVCETAQEVWQAILDMSIAECARRHLDFVGFEIIAS